MSGAAEARRKWFRVFYREGGEHKTTEVEANGAVQAMAMVARNRRALGGGVYGAEQISGFGWPFIERGRSIFPCQLSEPEGKP